MMTANITELDAHEQPSDELKAKWKAYSRTEQKDLLEGGDIDDYSRLSESDDAAPFVLAGSISAGTLNESFKHICPADPSGKFQVTKDAPFYYHPLLPGLLIYPSVVPPEVQKILLRHLIHRDLSDPRHQTNLHLHYNLPYPKEGDGAAASFFSYPPDSCVRFEPKDPQIHKQLSIKQVLERKLHWVTLGGQYDWTNRVYPGERPPDFPADIAAFLETLFPETLAQAAIVNFYTPGDTMMMHRDVSEETDKGLVSVSIGCDSLFMIAPDDIGKISEEERKEWTAKVAGSDRATERGYLLLRLRSGDAIYMTKESRFAWHGVPKVLKGTCPKYLENWPADDENEKDEDKYEQWRGWMRDKRINLNVRQMRD
ncbi:alpha-ketoglutarate-dependent dioxygenase abh1 [Diplogelasinospora grovesii]|uniref:mRNA N(6)-methyladenine demethylase n=1 Tax=Diplogelasinospora grovesii TaxID=303347 RepID=A0AAN6S5R6_9PEZI|nr:alpha-ketoglutarate-dependent dioxygenase abh1 [Diplogelasinospora grovesii]